VISSGAADEISVALLRMGESREMKLSNNVRPLTSRHSDRYTPMRSVNDTRRFVVTWDGGERDQASSGTKPAKITGDPRR